MTRSLTRLLDPRSIAFVGGGAGARAIVQCDRLGFEGDIWPVHPHAETIEGRPAFRSLEDLPAVPDAAFVAVNRRLTVDFVRGLADMGAGGAVLHASGFAESGEEGAHLQRQLIAGHDMPLIGPNCYGTINARSGAALWPDVHGCVRVDRGPAFIGQSGNISLNATMNQRGVRFSHVASVGNQASVTVEDLIAHLAADPATTAIGVYLESLNDAVAFGQAATTAHERGVPIVVLRSGQTTISSGIATTHTAAMARPADVYRAVFDRYGVIVVDSLSELLTTLALHETVGPLPGNRLISLSCSGGEAAIVADRAAHHDVEFEPIVDGHADRLQSVLSDRVPLTNPLDYHTYVWGDADGMADVFGEALDGPVDAAMLVLDWPTPGNDDADWWTTVHAIVAASGKTGTPAVVATSLPEGMPGDVRRHLADLGVGAAPSIDEALAGLAAMAGLGSRATSPRSHPHDPPGRVADETAVLLEPAAKKLLGAAGIRVPRGAVVSAGETLPELDFPVAAKRIDTAHKSDLGGVVLGLRDATEVAAAVEELGGTALVEEQVVDGVVELLVSVRRIAGIGVALTLGAGGTLVEVLDDTATLLLGVRGGEVETAVAALRIAPLMRGHRGAHGASIPAVVEAVDRLQQLVRERPEVQEVEINPLIVTAHEAWAVDALVTVDASAAIGDPTHTLGRR